MTTNTWEMTPQQLAETFGPYLHQTAYIPRPEVERGAPAYAAKQQRQWDAAEADRQRIKAQGAETEARLDREAQAEHAALRRADAERATAERATIEAIVRGRYFLAAGATEDAWQRNRERLVDQEIERMGDDEDQAGRGRFAAMVAG